MRKLALDLTVVADPTVGRRINYAFSTFCAVYGYQAVQGRGDDVLCVRYGAAAGDTRSVGVAATYRARPLRLPAPAPVWVTAGVNSALHSIGVERFPCFHGVAAHSGIDWLGESFEWLSGAHEYSVTCTDQAGRVPFAKTLHGQFGIDPTVPWAGVCFAALNSQLCHIASEWPAEPAAIVPGKVLTFAASHDVDFLPTSPGVCARRWLKNALIAALVYRDGPLLGQLVRNLILRRGPGLRHGLRYCLDRERQFRIKASYNVVAASAHRRDPDYRLGHRVTRQTLATIQDSGMEVGLHGSYNSLDSPGALASEAAALRAAGVDVRGGRQHWLRYNGPVLFREACRAGLAYDTSVGYPSRPGFRCGACFPYAPFDFGSESCYPLIEIPLVLMDTALWEGHASGGDGWSAISAVVAALRRFSRGGVSLLWHDTVLGGGQLPQHLADCYWGLWSEDDAWLAPGTVESLFRPRALASGLLNS